MIEAVNSVLSSSVVSRGVVEQQSTTRSLTANPEKIQEAAKAPYVSPYISIDRTYNKAVLQIRDSDTGDVVRQFPTEGQLKAYRTAQQFSERQRTHTHTQVREATGVSTPETSVELPTVSDVAAPSARASSPATPTTDTPVPFVKTEA